LNCEVFQSLDAEGKKEQTVIHHYMPQEVSIRSFKQSGVIKDSIFINRTDLNEQYFRINFTDDLAFLDVENSQFYVHKQDPQWREVSVPKMANKQAFVDF
jgi:hypothetical protein